MERGKIAAHRRIQAIGAAAEVLIGRGELLVGRGIHRQRGGIAPHLALGVDIEHAFSIAHADTERSDVGIEFGTLARVALGIDVADIVPCRPGV